MKIFLSHSSNDKDIVGQVFHQLGPGICHYDIATFDPTGFLPDEIYSALAESTHFVFFASAAALKSGWVQGELKNLFINWMRSKTVNVMVFLMRGGDRTQIPDWLQNYVITEHPSPMHIACRILSEYDKWRGDKDGIPPFYRSSELKVVEKQLAVEAAKMPSCILISGTDGSGRKELVNQIFSRLFRNVAPRKILLYSENFDTDVDLFKSLKGVLSLTTPRELTAAVDEYKSLDLDNRIIRLASLIKDICGKSQALIVDAADSIFTDAGEINEWLGKLIIALPNDSYPLVTFTSNRKPSYINQILTERLVVCHIEPLQDDDSQLLFKWWLNSFEVDLPHHIFELVLEQVSGNPKLIESAARLLRNISDLSDVRLIKRSVFSDLEKASSRLMVDTAKDDLARLILALIVECGHIAKSDLISIVAKVTGSEVMLVAERHSDLEHYGLIQSDSVCVRLPNFLNRIARSFGKVEPISKQLASCWQQLGDSLQTVTWDDETSISIINEACILSLKSGVNSITGIESLILPSQCLRIARQLYDRNEYSRAYQLCVRAYQGRLALTDDGAIEALRYRGMTAARLNSEEKLKETLAQFSEYSTIIRAQRIAEFIQGFDFRLAGKFDDALYHMLNTLKFKGDQDVHVLRELAFLYLANGDPDKAKLYVGKAIGKARNNSFILELQIQAELAFGKGYVVHHHASIEDLIDNLDSIATPNKRNYGLRARIEYLLARGDTREARSMFDRANLSGQSLSVVNRLLEAKILIAEKRFQTAYEALVSLKKSALESKGAQRRSILPMAAELLIEAAAGVSIATGIIEYQQNGKHLMKATRLKVRDEIKEMVAYSKMRISDEQRAMLEH